MGTGARPLRPDLLVEQPPELWRSRTLYGLSLPISWEKKLGSPALCPSYNGSARRVRGLRTSPSSPCLRWPGAGRCGVALRPSNKTLVAWLLPRSMPCPTNGIRASSPPGTPTGATSPSTWRSDLRPGGAGLHPTTPKQADRPVLAGQHARVLAARLVLVAGAGLRLLFGVPAVAWRSIALALLHLPARRIIERPNEAGGNQVACCAIIESSGRRRSGTGL